MPQWGTFAGISIVVLLLLLALTRLTQRAFSGTDADDSSNGASGPRPDGTVAADRPDRNAIADDRPRTEADRREADRSGDRPFDAEPVERRGDAPLGDEATEPTLEGPRRIDGRRPARPEAERDRRGGEVDPSDLSTGALLVNVALSQGLFAGVLIGAAIYADIPASALGVEFSRSYLVSGLLVGTAVGLGLYVANEIGAASATRLGFDHDEELRGALAPDSPGGWLVLLVGVLPVIAVFEELLFRAALIGALSAGFGIDPWLLAILSSIAFGVGHGMQGSVGVVVTAALGFVLAGVFVHTGSLLVVVVAHYLINAFEFVVHEGLGFDWAETVAS